MHTGESEWETLSNEADVFEYEVEDYMPDWDEGLDTRELCE